jgi:isopenicillin N synthase-like dioxygenase
VGFLYLVGHGIERDAVPQGTGVPPRARLQGPNQWPPALPSLRPALTAYTDAATALAIRLLRAFAEALGQREIPPDPRPLPARTV